MTVKIWVPGWEADVLPSLLSGWKASGGRPESLLLPNFPSAPTRRAGERRRPRRYDIVHFAGTIWFRQQPYLELGKRRLAAGDLVSILAAARTRLLILEVDEEAFSAAAETGYLIARRGGPAVLSIAGGTTQDRNRYFLDVYAGLLHNKSLSKFAPPTRADAGLRVNLTFAKGGADLLRFDGTVARVLRRLQRTGRKLDRETAQVQELQHRTTRRLHRIQFDELAPLFDASRVDIQNLQTALGGHFSVMREVTERPWDHESEGVVPLAATMAGAAAVGESLQQVAGDVSKVAAAAAEEEARAPRVLNANFARPDGTVLKLRDGLVAGGEYSLLVDVGPRWTTIPTIVDKDADFPEDALPAGRDGYGIEIVLVSDEIEPHLVSGSLWLPTSSGRSFPIVDGQRSEQRGPISLRFQVRQFPADSDTRTRPVRGRLCVYYENNLLQSAAVKATIARSLDDAIGEDNDIHVDFTLTNSFVALEPRFARRAVRMTPDDPVSQHPVKVSLVMNDDGAQHRIIVRRRIADDGGVGEAPPGDLQAVQACPAQGWTPYDVLGGLDLLNGARDRLVDCFYARDATGAVKRPLNGAPAIGFDATNGKSRDQFTLDLVQLAVFGRDVFNRAFGQLQLPGGTCSAAEWKQALRQTVKDASVIQVARTGPGDYVFPWAFVYDYPLIDAQRKAWQTCPVIVQEWSAEGQRRGSIASRCPFDDKPWHEANIICPYGLWGLRHIIEEPPSATAPLATAQNSVLGGPTLNLSVATTGDPALKTGIAEHLVRMREIKGVAFDPDAEASDWASVVAMLEAPEIAYFLCHGEYDPSDKKTYINVGPGNRISPDDFLGWAQLKPPQGPDIQAWKRRHPFIFINGCHTSALKPGEIVNFVSCFADLEASGVLGTEVSVILPVAAEVAESLFTSLAAAEAPTIGEALRSVRWSLANKGNLLGLAYTLYGLADIHVVTA